MHSPFAMFFVNAILHSSTGENYLPSSRGASFFAKMAMIGTMFGISAVVLLHFVVGPALITILLG